MAQDRQNDDDALAEHREENGIGVPGSALHQEVDGDAREHRLHPTPPHEHDHVGGDGQ